MAVMSKMRDLTKVILYILVLTFVGTIIFDWGMSYTGRRTNTNVVGEVNGVEITLKEYDQALTAQMQQYRNQSGGELPESQVDFIRNQVWNAMVQDVLLRQVFDDKKIKAANAEIVYRLFNAPPEFLKTLPGFQNEQQQFDMAKYQQAINDPNMAAQWRPIEQYMREYLPREKLEQQLQASVLVTDDEVRREYLKRYQNAKVRYVFFNPRDIDADKFEITDKMIADYYASHKEEYQQPEQRAIEYVIFPTQATPADSAEIRERADRVLERAHGEDFADLALTYSDDAATKDKGGELGYFKKGDLVAFRSFEDELFNATPGDILGPFQTSQGLHVVKLTDKRINETDKQEEVQASQILFKFMPSRKTMDNARADAEYLAEQAEETSFAEAAKALGDSVSSTGLFVKGIFVPGVGRNQSIMNFTFNNPVGSIAPVIETDPGFIVYMVSKIKKKGTKPLEEVKTLVKNKILSDKRMARVGEHAKQAYDKIQAGQPLDEVAIEDSLEIKETAKFTRSGSVAGVGRDTKFIGAAFALKNVGDISKPVAGTRGYYILELQEKDAFDQKDFDSKKAQIATSLKQSRQGQAFSTWYSQLKETAEINDYRAQFYN